LPAAVALFCGATANAQTNLLTNGDFQDRFAIQTLQTYTCTGQSSAVDWNTNVQGPCGIANSGLELETDLLLGSSSPSFPLNVHVIHIRVEPMVPTPSGDPSNSGITQVFATAGPFPTRVLTSLWVYVVRGQVGTGAGPAGDVPITTYSSTLGSWQQLVGVSGASPAVQFNIYGTDPGGSEFYASNAVVCPADTDSDLAACLAFVGAGPGAANLAGLTIVPSSVTGGQGATGTLTLSSPAPAGGAQATLSSNSPAAGVPPSVTVPEGQISASFPVTTTPVTSTTVATITAMSANTVSAGLTINPGNSGTITGLTISPPAVTGGQGATGTVTMSAPAPAGGVSVSLASNNPTAGVPPSVNVPQGQTSASFPVTTSPVSSTTTATITATSANSVSASLTINPAQSACVGALTLSTYDVLGGLSLQGIVALTAKAGIGGQPVNLSSTSAFVNVPAVVQVAEGQDHATFSIATKPVLVLTTPLISASVAACAAVTASFQLLP
jgi:hypothetical protein